MTSRVFSVHRIDPRFSGDVASSPSLWIRDLFDSEHLDIEHESFDVIRDSAQEGPVTVIVGGGGLFGHSRYARGFLRLAELANEEANVEVVVWGAGVDTARDHEISRSGMEILDVASVVGVRDVGTGRNWAPCASVLHPGLYNAGDPVGPVVAYVEMGGALLDQAVMAGIPLIVSRGPDVGEAIRFISSGECVVTDSWYGAYWATLLGRKVGVASAYSSSFDHLAWPLYVTKSADVYDAIEGASSFESAYEEAIAATNEMTSLVRDVVNR